ncbi:YopX family protein [Chitinophaga sp. Hz27]|uniref:YopX family protein n=1 Tax=Chitinophaga sp. Hz27 TaxID=3347169 RepID=UPI0035D6CC0A
MRQIENFKFRAWTGEKMVYNVSPFTWDFVLDIGMFKCIKSTGTGILGSGGPTAQYELGGIRYEAVMQYTGLVDKNKHPIYEGDIVNITTTGLVWETEYTWEGEVVFEDGRFTVRHENGKRTNFYKDRPVVVIGNIYENKK